MALEPARVATVALAAVLGPIFGSFVTALSYRLPRGESIAAGRSRCPACRRELGPADLVPIVSWLASGGRCRACGTAISPRYPIIEVLSLGFFVTTALAITDSWRLMTALCFIPVGLALAVTDFEHQRLPDVLIACLLPIAFVWRWQQGDLVAGLIAAVVAFGALAALDWVFIRLQGEAGLGGGDTKLITLAALAFQPFVFFGFLLIGSVLGVGLGIWWRHRTGDARFPFGVTLLFAFWFCVMLPLAPLRL